MSNRKRILRLFYYFTQNGGFITLDDLAKFLSVSVRTVKNEIDSLAAFCNAAGCELIKIRGKGYYLNVLDQSKFDETSEQVIRQFSDYTFTTEYKNIRIETVKLRVKCLLWMAIVNLMN